MSRGRRRFAASPGLTVLGLVAAALFVRLGFWQWHRGVEREAQWRRFAHGADQVETLGTRAATSVPLFQKVSVSGRLDPQHQFLLDNRSYQGRPGYEVLTPLLRAGAAAVLVDRGWVPFNGSRRDLPQVSFTPVPTVTLTGRLANLPGAGLAIGHAAPAPQDPWPQVTSFPTMDELAAALGVPLEPRIVLLDPGAAGGFVRDWRPAGLAPLRHLAYAIQWWSFAALVVMLWGLMSFRRPRRAGGP